MKKLSTIVLWLLMVAVSATAQTRIVGGDLSLVPAYETAGDKWLDANGSVINDMVTYMKNTAGWNSVRVRLLVDPSQDSYLATCQDIDYVKKLGKRIKDSGMYFLLDIFYSDTFTDVSQQWIPASWGMNRSTATATLASKVGTYTTEVLNTLTAYGATPDYIQLGNEVSYGMLWDNTSGASKNNACYPAAAYNTYATQWQRFATLLNAAATSCRTACPNAKLILHSERASNSGTTVNFYNFVERAGFTNYDIIGLSYYPFWHGTLSTLSTTLSALKTNFPTKPVQIVETAYYNTSSAGSDTDTNMSSTWAYSPAGQAAFLGDLINTIENHTNVNGLYYWQPEECGNGANSSGVSKVMDNWDNRGFWNCTWKSTTHTLDSKDALMTLKTYLGSQSGGGEGEGEEIDLSGASWGNLDFEECTTNESLDPWNVNWNLSWGDGPWYAAADDYTSSLVDGTICKAWAASGTSLGEGWLVYQTETGLTNGTYTVSAVIHTEAEGIYVRANDVKTEAIVNSNWDGAVRVTAEVKVTNGTLKFGIYQTAQTLSSDLNIYFDNFTISGISDGTGSGGGEEGTPDATETAVITGGTVTNTNTTVNTIYTQDYESASTTDWVSNSASVSIASATNNNSTDYSAKITNADCAATTGWTIDYNICGSLTAKIDSWSSEGSSDYIFSVWNSSATTTGNFLTQTISDIPNGTYTVTAKVHSASANVYLFAGSSKSTATASSDWASSTTLSITGVSVTDGTITVGLGCGSKGTINAYCDDFTLTCTALATTTTNHYTKLAGSTSAMTSAYLKFGNSTALGTDDTWVMTTDFSAPHTTLSGNGNQEAYIQLFGSKQTANPTSNSYVALGNSIVSLYRKKCTSLTGNAFSVYVGGSTTALSSTATLIPGTWYTLTVKGDASNVTEVLITPRGSATQTFSYTTATTNSAGYPVGLCCMLPRLGSSQTANTSVGFDNESLVYTTTTTSTETTDRIGKYTYKGITYSFNLETGETYVSGYETGDVETYANILGEFTYNGTSYYPTYIKEWALQDFPATSVTIPSSINVIGEGAFFKAANLNSVCIYSQYISIYNYAFTAWDESLADVNMGNRTTNFNDFTIYAEDIANVSISSKAFTADNIAAATLWVYPGLQTESTYTSLGFLHVYPIGYDPSASTLATYTYQGITYTYDTQYNDTEANTGTAWITAYDTEAEDWPTEEVGGHDLLGSFVVDGVTYYVNSIAEYALEGYPLWWVTIPTSCTEIGRGAFYKNGLYKITFYTNDYLTIYDYAFCGWDEDESVADQNYGSLLHKPTTVTIYAESTENVSISSKAFYADDINGATLWVVKGLENDATYTSLGFLHVYPMGMIKGDINEGGTVESTDVLALVKVITGETKDYNLYICDVNEDDNVTIADVTALIKMILDAASAE